MTKAPFSRKPAKRRFKATPLQVLTRPLLKQAMGKSAPALLTLVQNWQDIVPKEFTETTRAVKIRFPDRNVSRNGVLDLQVLPEAAFIVEHSTPKLVHAVNTYFGYPAIARVAIKQVSFRTGTENVDPFADLVKLPKPEPVAAIRDPEFAQQLANFADAVKRRTSRKR